MTQDRSALLLHVKEVEIRTTPSQDPFTIGDYFERNTGRESVKIFGLGDFFRSRFLGLVEQPTPSLFLINYHTLTRCCEHGGPIITELGGEDKPGLSFGEVWRFMMIDGYTSHRLMSHTHQANIFFVRIDGIIYMIHARAQPFGSSHAWFMDADFVDGVTNVCNDGDRVFSRSQKTSLIV
ncbi:MAG: hypothetical protein Q8P32_04980 [Candidatus Komeilibacteria bacterium]|nr:hypothetical protein [Candidatus Komeilibacteria bacterium]